jgi:hypothetical protein
MFMKHVYMKPLTEVVRVNCKEHLAWGELENPSNPDPYAGGHGGYFVDDSKDEKPVFDKWNNPLWDE